MTEHYKCEKCHKHGLKLWRDYQASIEHMHLTCAKCLGFDTVSDEGYIMTKDGFETDQLGWMVPAVNDYSEGGKNYWGYTHAPECDLQIWKDLPTYK